MNWQRPTSDYNISHGPLMGEQFQIAYATNDIERSKLIFQNTYGIKAFCSLQGQMPAGGHIQVALAWVGNTMYELLTASGPGAELYMSQLHPTNYDIKLHHLGFIIPTHASWLQLHDYFSDNNIPLLYNNHTEGFMHTCFIDAPELGHYLEYLYPAPAGLDFFLNKVPKH